jgi:hypothetical protein
VPRTSSTKLVIDADVASSSGETEHPTSIHCRQFLQQVLSLGCRVGMTDELRAEWNLHQSTFALNWLVTMTSKKLVEELEGVENKSLRDALFEAGSTQSLRRELLKDAHLLEAAIAFEKRVASRDDRARSRFADISRTNPVISKVCWVNPDKEHEDSMDWLQRGAPLEQHRRLSAYSAAK